MSLEIMTVLIAVDLTFSFITMWLLKDVLAREQKRSDTYASALLIRDNQAKAAQAISGVRDTVKSNPADGMKAVRQMGLRPR